MGPRLVQSPLNSMSFTNMHFSAIGIKFVLVEFVISKFVLVEFQLVQFFPGPKNCTKQGSFVYNIRIPNFTEFIFKNSVRFSEENRGRKAQIHLQVFV